MQFNLFLIFLKHKEKNFKKWFYDVVLHSITKEGIAEKTHIHKNNPLNNFVYTLLSFALMYVLSPLFEEDILLLLEKQIYKKKYF